MNILGLSSPKVLPDLWSREVHPTPWASMGSSARAEEVCDSFLDSSGTVRRRGEAGQPRGLMLRCGLSGSVWPQKRV